MRDSPPELARLLASILIEKRDIVSSAAQMVRGPGSEDTCANDSVAGRPLGALDQRSRKQRRSPLSTIRAVHTASIF